MLNMYVSNFDLYINIFFRHIIHKAYVVIHHFKAPAQHW